VAEAAFMRRRHHPGEQKAWRKVHGAQHHSIPRESVGGLCRKVSLLAVVAAHTVSAAIRAATGDKETTS